MDKRENPVFHYIMAMGTRERERERDGVIGSKMDLKGRRDKGTERESEGEGTDQM